MSGDFFVDGLAKLHLRPSAPGFRAFIRLRNRILRRADCFVAISSEVAEELRQEGVKPGLVHMIPNCVDTGRFCPPGRGEKRALRQRLGLGDGEKIVTFCGRLVSYKGLPLLVRVWREIAEQHGQVRLLLVGAGGGDIHNCEAELWAYVQAHGLSTRVQMTGDVRNVHEYLQASDVFVFPTENEAFGLSLVEAMACGLPVISTPVGGVKDILKHGQNGLVVKTGDYRELYDALELLIMDDSLAARLGRAARQTAEDRYAMDAVIQAYIRLFGQIAGSHSERAVLHA
jgi:glycosyltransferase involved in cell wall biosynthesis